MAPLNKSMSFDKVTTANESLTPAATLFILLLCTMFGANAVAIKFTITGLGPFNAAVLRFSLSAAAIAIWARWRRQPFAIAAGQRRPLFILALLFAFQFNLFYLGMSRTHASRAALIVNLVPFFVLILAHFFIPGDRLSLRRLGGIVLGFCGVAILIADDKAVTGQLRSGDLIMLAAALIWSTNAVYSKKVIHRFKPFQIVFYPMLAAIGLFALEAFYFEGLMEEGSVSLPIAVALLYQGLGVSAFGFVSWNTLLSHLGAGTLHSFIFLMPLAAVFFSGILLAEPITLRLLLAVLLVVCGLLTIHLRGPRGTTHRPSKRRG
jgi:drug/metabolite transporter (DMT)-like permease